mgnify:CR=1 FL=1
MNKTIQELVPLIQEWAKERGIFDKSTPFDQLLKTHEEVGELIKACYDNDKPAIQDAIGDVLVTLINYCYMVEENVNHIIKHALNSSPDTKSPPVRLAIFSEVILTDLLRYECKQGFKLSHISPYSNTLYIIKNLISIALLESTTLEECLNIAYNEIKNRTGKMINGKFVKNEE